MLFLDSLWNGNATPGGRRYHPDREYNKRMCKVEEYEAKVKEELSEKGEVNLDQFADAWLSFTVLEEADKFIDGFRMGVMLMMDVLCPNRDQEVEEI